MMRKSSTARPSPALGRARCVDHARTWGVAASLKVVLRAKTAAALPGAGFVHPMGRQGSRGILPNSQGHSSVHALAPLLIGARAAPFAGVWPCGMASPAPAQPRLLRCVRRLSGWRGDPPRPAFVKVVTLPVVFSYACQCTTINVIASGASHGDLRSESIAACQRLRTRMHAAITGMMLARDGRDTPRSCLRVLNMITY